ncbi:response regulator transcription factor [Myroides sp. WP-1]|uniref:response regulator transcription factor n=1 Tax=Myroides sp. WP-1 TaxID=2759944 RepID=UPI0015FD41DD|nr:response regulator transcription factor [Myroides sp. WP-1]MBB1140016.1 response regulator transcription factor [Myroides sp. WP-1]
MKILIIESNALLIEGYIAVLGNEKHTFLKVANGQDFFALFTKAKDLDLALITDHSMDVFERKLKTGLDCALFIKKNIPYCKIILLTEHEKALVLYELYKTIKVDALLVKSDFTKELFCDLVTATKIDFPYISPSAKKAIQTMLKNASLLDSKNRQILFLLAQGYRMNQISDQIVLSRSATQKRVSKLLVAFNVNNYHELLGVLKERRIV